MAIVRLRNSRDVSERAIRAPDGPGQPRTAPGALRFESRRRNHEFRRPGLNDPFISRKVLQSQMQFGFGTSAFFAIFVLQSATAGCLDSTEKSGKFVLAVKRVSCFAVRPAPYGTGYGFLRHYGAGYMRLLLQRFSRAVRWVSKQ